MKEWIFNPKTRDSGIITCIPQTGRCPNNCEDCFFQSGRSYLEPLSENLPHIPPPELTTNRIVRINDGNDSNVQRELVEKTSSQFDNYFFNTAIPKDLELFSAPVVLTINPAKKTDKEFFKLDPIPNNLMFVRVRVNTWNINSITKPSIKYYTEKEIPVVLTFMAYYKNSLPISHEFNYEWKQRTINSYWVLTENARNKMEQEFKDNPLVYSCGYKGTFPCKRCGNCIREYFNTLEKISKRI